MEIEKYPHIQNLSNHDELDKFLGNTVYWEVKEDGSNIGFYISNKGEPHICSRNCSVANFEERVLKLQDSVKVFNFISDYEFQTGRKIIVYGEFLGKGKSPTGLKVYDYDSFKIFDILDVADNKYWHYYDTYNACKDYELPMVDLVCVTKSKNIQQFYINCQIALDVVDTTKKGFSLWFIRKCRHYKPLEEQEGVVGKCYLEDGTCVFIKNKFIREPKRKVKQEDVVKQVIPRGVIREKVWNVYVELGDDFFDVKKAMPKIAEVINEEARQTDSIYVDNIFNVYQEVLCDIQEVRNDII